MKFLPLLALLISPFVSALNLDDLQQRFTEQPVIRAHFDQTRTIKICRSRYDLRARC